MDAPKYQQPPTDPGIVALRQQTQQQDVAAAGATASLDTARLMSVYGTRLALGGVGNGSPLVRPNVPGWNQAALNNARGSA